MNRRRSMKKETRNAIVGGFAMTALSGVLNPIIQTATSSIVDKMTHKVNINDYCYIMEAGITKYFTSLPDVFYLNMDNEPDFKKNTNYWQPVGNSRSTIWWGGYPITFSMEDENDSEHQQRCHMWLTTLNTKGAIENMKRFIKHCVMLQHQHMVNKSRSDVSVYGTGRRMDLCRFVLSPFVKRTFSNTFIPDEQEKLIKESLDKFVARRDWYMENHIPYHFGFLLYGEAGTGKAEPLTNKIPTPTEKGYTLMGDLKVGDYVFDVNGMKTKVTHIFDQGVRDIYTVKFSDGRKIDVSDEHLFGVFTLSHGKEKYSVRSVTDMLKDYRCRNKRDRKNADPYHYRYKIPRPLCANYPSRKVPIHPWVLGCFIGNGCCKERYLTISSGTDEIPHFIADIYNYTYKRNSEKNYNYTFYDEKHDPVKTEDFFKDIPEIIGCYSRNKKIPDEYIHNDINTRLLLIQGLMDTDGSITRSGDRFHISYSSTSKTLLEQIQYILYSFGFSSTISTDKRGKEKYVEGFCGTLNINISNKEKYKLFALGRKRSLAHMAWKFGKHYATKYDNLLIKDISFSRKEECRCIMVESPLHLYLTENFIVTHNTTVAQAIADHIGAELTVFPGDAINDFPKIIGTDFDRVPIDPRIYRVICIEDVDCGFAQSRMDTYWEDDEEKEVKRKVGLAEILNCIDGLQAPQNVIYVLTTNHIEKLDPALIRPGRCDVKLEIPTVTLETLIKFCKHHYPNENHTMKWWKSKVPAIKDGITFAEIQTHVMKGATLSELCDKVKFKEVK